MAKVSACAQYEDQSKELPGSSWQLYSWLFNLIHSLKRKKFTTLTSNSSIRLVSEDTNTDLHRGRLVRTPVWTSIKVSFHIQNHNSTHTSSKKHFSTRFKNSQLWWRQQAIKQINSCIPSLIPKCKLTINPRKSKPSRDIILCGLLITHSLAQQFAQHTHAPLFHWLLNERLVYSNQLNDNISLCCVWGCVNRLLLILYLQTSQNFKFLGNY